MGRIINGKNNIEKNYNIQRRLNAKRHRKNRKRKLITFYIFLIISILLIGSFFVIHKFFKVTTIEITGSKIYNQEHIRKSVNVDIGQNIFKYRSSTISKTLKDKLIYVDNALVKKKFPNKILIRIIDSKPKYLLKNKHKYFIISNYMKILESKDKKPITNLVEIKGISISNKDIGDFILDHNKKWDILYKINQVLKNNDFKNITQIDLTSKNNIKLNYQNRISILIGNDSQLNYKIKFIRSIINKNIDKNEKGTIDATNVSSNSKVYFSPYKEPIKKLNNEEGLKKIEKQDELDKKE